MVRENTQSHFAKLTLIFFISQFKIFLTACLATMFSKVCYGWNTASPPNFIETSNFIRLTDLVSIKNLLWYQTRSTYAIHSVSQYTDVYPYIFYYIIEPNGKFFLLLSQTRLSICSNIFYYMLFMYRGNVMHSGNFSEENNILVFQYFLIKSLFFQCSYHYTTQFEARIERNSLIRQTETFHKSFNIQFFEAVAF